MQGTAKTRVMGGPGSFNRWNWQCECGALSRESFADREDAREALKQHRKTHRKQAAPKAAPPPPKTEEPKTVATKVKKPNKGEQGEKKTRRRRVLVTPEQAKEALARLKAKESTLIAESKRLGFRHNGPLRKALRELLGRDVYAKLMEGRRGRLPRPKPAKAKKAKAPKPAQPEETTTP